MTRACIRSAGMRHSRLFRLNSFHLAACSSPGGTNRSRAKRSAQRDFVRLPLGPGIYAIHQ